MMLVGPTLLPARRQQHAKAMARFWVFLQGASGLTSVQRAFLPVLRPLLSMQTCHCHVACHWSKQPCSW